MKLKRKLPILILLILIITTVHAQRYKQFSFTHYGTSSGLASNEVITSVQDSSGYIWIGTTNGLQRFDGVRFLTFNKQKNNPASLPENYVSQILFDKENNMWIQVGGDRVGIFNTRNFTFREVPIHPTNELHVRNDKHLRVDEEGNILMIIGNLELLTYNKERN